MRTKNQLHKSSNIARIPDTSVLTIGQVLAPSVCETRLMRYVAEEHGVGRIGVTAAHKMQGQK